MTDNIILLLSSSKILRTNEYKVIICILYTTLTPLNMYNAYIIIVARRKAGGDYIMYNNNLAAAVRALIIIIISIDIVLILQGRDKVNDYYYGSYCRVNI